MPIWQRVIGPTMAAAAHLFLVQPRYERRAAAPVVDHNGQVRQ